MAVRTHNRRLKLAVKERVVGKTQLYGNVKWSLFQVSEKPNTHSMYNFFNKTHPSQHPALPDSTQVALWLTDEVHKLTHTLTHRQTNKKQFWRKGQTVCAAAKKRKAILMASKNSNQSLVYSSKKPQSYHEMSFRDSYSNSE